MLQQMRAAAQPPASGAYYVDPSQIDSFNAA
jgi:hypothetical protein